MFGGKNKEAYDPAFPMMAVGNPIQYGTNVSQLQLFGTQMACDLSVGIVVRKRYYFRVLRKKVLQGVNANPESYAKADQFSSLNRQTKRSRNADNISKQQMLQFSLNTFPVDDNQPAKIPHLNTVSTGLRLFYDDEEWKSSTTSTTASMPVFSSTRPFCEDLRTQMDCQVEELDYYLRVQADQLAKGLREMNRRHTSSFLNAVEKDACKRLREKEIEIEETNKKNKDLMDRIRQLTVEAQFWQKRAYYNESLVNALRSNLSNATAQAAEQYREGYGENEMDTAASSCGPNMNCSVIPQEQGNEKMTCKICRTNESCVLIGDCRHLSLCEDCENLVDACPTCNVVKTSVLRVYIS